ncbi:tetratricopeptide repeat protein [Erythrobacteraceae bacterium CFH 75059]|uniref:tetratricopeptide repeat protein n=1 Tax=Qipengyuania thermophila TaxID=2509361 RepID=UPI001021577B|nr:tetratricopeptide repeat protein [Qipengyuania thermophila]TCD04856.1 tetratricopeptide repeat protein [Erythrobacteraceae bacterium CFH 75059]
MTSIQPFCRVSNPGTGRLTALAAAALLLLACSSSAEKASEAGAVAEYHLRSGNVEEARRAIRDAIRHKDDIAQLHLLRGQIEFAAGDRAAAFEAYYDALALDPLNPEALQAVAQLGVTTGNIREAEAAADRILTLAPEQPDALLVKGLVALARRRHDQTIALAERALAARPGDENARILKARALYLKGNPAGALAALEEGRPSGAPITVGVALTRLEIFRQTANTAGLDEEFTRLRNLRPNDPGLRIDEANYRYKRGQAAEAVRLIVALLTSPEEQFRDAGATSAEAAARVVSLWQQYGDDAVTPADWSRLAQGATPAVRAILARHLVLAGHAAAAERMSAGLARDEQEAFAAKLRMLSDDAAGALRLAGGVLARDETHCDALVAHSQALRALGRAAEAVQSGQRAAAECPDRPDAVIAAAAAYDAFERPAGAERVFAQGLSRNPQDLLLARSYAEWLFANGQKRQATAILRRYTRDTPASVRGWQLYADMCRRTGSGCAGAAEEGAARARRMYGIDLPPGQIQPNGLFGRFIER